MNWDTLSQLTEWKNNLTVIASKQGSIASKQARFMAIVTSNDPLDQELVLRLAKQRATYWSKVDEIQEVTQAHNMPNVYTLPDNLTYPQMYKWPKNSNSCLVIKTALLH